MKIKVADRTLCGDCDFGFKEKIEIARQLENLSVDAIELPKIENDKADTLLIRTIASFVKNAVISIEVHNVADVDKALLALNTAAKKRIRVELPVSCVGMEYTFHKKAPKMLEIIKETVAYAKSKCQDVEFCAIDATRAEEDFLKEVVSEAVNAGATLVTFCDSTAEMMPNKFGEFVEEYKIDGAEIGVMCEDKNGLAAADAVIATQKGANTVKTAVGGSITSLSTFAGILKNCGGVCGFESPLKFTQLNRIIGQIGWITKGNKNDKSVGNIVNVADDNLVLDANDDKETVMSAVLKLGYDLSETDSTKVYEEFLRAAAKKRITAKELEAIVATVALQVEPTYKLINYVVNSGNIITSTAQITLEKDGNALQGISTGDGPIDAAFHAVEQIIGCHYELDDFQIQSITEGKGAMGGALVKLRRDGKLYSGNGISTDIIGASIKAYINAVNKIVYEEA
jgi:2-isopropylmalate synthase